MTAWNETRHLNVALRDAKKNGRVGKLFSVLRDGEPRTRREIFERVGFMLTNNVASELRAELEPQGYGVAQWRAFENGEWVYVYQLVSLRKPPQSGTSGADNDRDSRVSGRGGFQSDSPSDSGAAAPLPSLDAAPESQLALPLPSAALRPERAA